MMIFRTELRKLLASRIFLLISAAVLVLNGYLIIRTANSGDARPSDYRDVYSAIEGETDEEKLAWLDEELTHFDRPEHYNFTVLSELREECYNAVHYKEYLDNIDAQAKSMTSVSIFAKKGTFNYRSIQKTPPAYDSVRGIEPRFDVSQGILLATDNSFTDILLGFILLFSVLAIMISDREQGMSGLLFSMKRGRGYLYIAKCGTLAAVTFGAVLILYGENLVMAAYIYGLGDLSRPVQSLGGFIGCNLKISVAGYLMIYVLFKFAAMYAIGSMLTLIAVNTRSNAGFYGVSAALLITEGLAYKRIEPLSVKSIFRYVNLISFTKVNENFCCYKNINFRGYPVPLILTATTAMVVFTVLCIGLSVFLYGKKRNLEFRRIGLKLFIKRAKKVRRPLYYAFYKSLVLQKGAVVILAMAFVFASVYNSFFKRYDYADTYYRYYTEQYEGDITPGTLRFCDEETARFEELHAKLSELQEKGDCYSKEYRETERQLAPEVGFQLFRERVETVSDVPDAVIFYDTGYKRAFGLNGYDDDMKYALAAVLMCIFLVSPLIAGDNRFRMGAIINSTASGRSGYLARNMLIAALYGISAADVWNVLYCKSISDYYRHAGLTSPVQSIAELHDFPLDMAVWQYIVLILLIRTAALILSALAMLWVSSKSRNVTAALLVNFAVFALPVIIYLLGAKLMAKVSFTPLLSANVLLNEKSYAGVIIVLAAAVTAKIYCRVKI